jgi:hypothetical protein
MSVDYCVAGIFFYRKLSEIIFLGKIMEAVSGVPAVKPGPKLGANQAMIMGRINHTSTFDAGGKRVHEARVAIAARDTFSMPGAVLVQSSYKLGNVGEDVSVTVEVTGFPDKWTDKNTGEVKQTARIVLRVIE